LREEGDGEGARGSCYEWRSEAETRTNQGHPDATQVELKKKKGSQKNNTSGRGLLWDMIGPV